MRRLILAAAAVAATLAVPALAQGRHGGGGGGGHGGGGGYHRGGGGGGFSARPQGAFAGRQTFVGRPGFVGRPATGYVGPTRTPRTWAVPPSVVAREGYRGGAYVGGGYRDGRYAYHSPNYAYRSAPGLWYRGWRRNPYYDWRAYRTYYPYLYRVPAYYDPYGWGYRRFFVGVTLDPLFYSDQYWINDPYYYRLPPADYGYRWVRYYDDAMLVDTGSGEVVDVIYGFFIR